MLHPSTIQDSKDAPHKLLISLPFCTLEIMDINDA